MPGVLVIGANGYIGKGLARAFAQSGYIVYGAVRSEEKAKDAGLLRAGVVPVVGDVGDVIPKVVAVIDTVADPSVAFNRTLMKAVADASTPVYPKYYIYVSGVLVYADSDKIRDEAAAPANPLGKWRIDFEEEVIKAATDSLNTAVVRPGYLYGYSGSYVGAHFKPTIEDGKLVIVGNKDRRYTYIHLDDLADMFVRIVDAGARVSGEVFNAGNGEFPTEEEVALAAARVAVGFDGDVKVLPLPSVEDNWFQNFADVSCMCSSAKAERLLGWRARALPLLHNLDHHWRIQQAFE